VYILNDLREWAPLFARGVIATLEASVISMALASTLGLFIALARIINLPRGLRAIQYFLRGYVEVLRGLPLIVTLFIIFFGLPAIGFTVSNNPMVAGIFGLTLSLGAYLSEVFRAAVLSVDPGQMEAAQSLGMSMRQSYQRIVVPQALLVAVPTLGSYFIGLLKDSSLLGFISVFDLMRSGVVIVTVTFKAFEVYFMVGGIYLLMSLIAAWFVSKVEKRLRPLEEAYTGKPKKAVVRDVILAKDELIRP
jgi:His/Glu/Gln/Arg/opine family amino acid ABC transporter permease subunit